MEQTAVEFAIQEVEKLAGIKIAKDEDCVKKINEMFREQITDAYMQGATDNHWGLYGNNSWEQYYNETFKSE